MLGVLRGAQMERNANDEWKVTHLNNGHWGELTYDGCMAVREGKMVEMDKNKVLKSEVILLFTI